jgi:hypothetical protein
MTNTCHKVPLLFSHRSQHTKTGCKCLDRSETEVMTSWSPTVGGLNRLLPKEIRSRQWLISEESWQTSFETSYVPPLGGGRSESSELVIEDQAFFPSYDLAPPPTLPLSSQQGAPLLSLLCVAIPAFWDRGGGAKSYGNKGWSSINHSILVRRGDSGMSSVLC